MLPLQPLSVTKAGQGTLALHSFVSEVQELSPVLWHPVPATDVGLWLSKTSEHSLAWGDPLLPPNLLGSQESPLQPNGLLIIWCLKWYGLPQKSRGASPALNSPSLWLLVLAPAEEEGGKVGVWVPRGKLKSGSPPVGYTLVWAGGSQWPWCVAPRSLP